MQVNTRDGSENPIVRTAIENVRLNIAAFPAGDVLQLVVFPRTIAEVAAEVGENESLISNLCRRHRPYVRLRVVLAEHLRVPLEILTHLIEATIATPLAKELPGRKESLAAIGLWASRPSIDFGSPPYPRYREGNNPLEQIAVLRMQHEAAAMPRSRLVSYALFPDTISLFARKHGHSLAQVLATLGNSRRWPRIERALARRLGVSRDTLEHFIASEKREPSVTLPAMMPQVLQVE